MCSQGFIKIFTRAVQAVRHPSNNAFQQQLSGDSIALQPQHAELLYLLHLAFKCYVVGSASDGSLAGVFPEHLDCRTAAAAAKEIWSP